MRVLWRTRSPLKIYGQWTLDLVSRMDRNPPQYTALSYTWGDKKLEPPQTLNIAFSNSSVKTFPIHQENLYSFLGQARPGHLPADNGATIRRAPNVGYLWVDAISIDQSEDASKEEKVAQLKLMSRIYASACRLIIWLGPDRMNTVNADAPFPENLWLAHPTGHAMTSNTITLLQPP